MIKRHRQKTLPELKQIRNRITAIQTIKLSELEPHPQNPRQHPAPQRVGLIHTLNEVGWAGVPLAYRTATGRLRLIDGHLRQELAPDITVSVAVTDLTEQEAAKLLSVYDAVGTAAEIDQLKMEALLNAAQWEEQQIAQLITHIARDHPAPVTNQEQANLPEQSSQEPPITQPGDLWALGQHRLICGDSTDATVYQRLLETMPIDLCFTSPPYNAGNQITGAYHVSNDGRSDFKKMYQKDHDNLPLDAYKKFLWQVLNNLATVATDTTPVLWNVCYNTKSRAAYGEIVFSPNNPLTVKETIVWDKGLGMNVAASGILSRTAELIFLMSKGARYTTNQQPNEVWWNIWRISSHDGENMQQGHGASFPIALVQEALVKFSASQAIVLDPFGGSGTTLMACEQASRRARLIELMPAYCDITIRRWEQLTGQQAQRLC